MPTILTLPEGMPTLLDAYDTVLDGGPTNDERRVAPRLDFWTAEAGIVWPVLHGRPSGHPRLTRYMRTSPLLYADADRGIARCLSRWYTLGSPGRIAPAPDISEAQTQFEQALFQAWREREDDADRTERSVRAAVLANPSRMLAAWRDQIDASVAERLRTLVERWPEKPRCVLRATSDGDPS